MCTFDAAFDRLMELEGGYSNHQADSGGETMYGMTKAVAAAHGYTGPMALMPKEFAKDIYWSAYWKPLKADQLPPMLRYAVFDAAVNSGVFQAVKWLQKAVGETEDGLIGPKTVTSANVLAPDAILRRMLSARLQFMTGLTNWEFFGKGWARRIATILAS